MSLKMKKVVRADAPNLVKANPMQKEFDGNLDLTQQVFAETKYVENPVPVQDDPKEDISGDEYEEIQVTSARGKNPLADFLYHMHDRFQKRVRGEDELEEGVESEAGINFADKTLTVGPANQHMNIVNAPLFQADVEEDVEDIDLDLTPAEEQAGVFDDMDESDVFESKAQDSFDDNDDYKAESSFRVYTDEDSTYDNLGIEQDDDSLDDAIASVMNEDELDTKSTRDLRSSLEEAIDLMTPSFQKQASGFPFIPMEKIKQKNLSEETIAKLREYDEQLEDYLSDEDSDYLVETTKSSKIPVVKKYK